MKFKLLSLLLIFLSLNSYGMSEMLEEEMIDEEGGATVLLGNGSGDIAIIPTENAGDYYQVPKVTYDYDSIKFPAIIGTIVEGDMVVFEQCVDAYNCKFIGRPYGYELEFFEFSPNMKRTKAVAYGLGEGLAIVGGGLTALLTGAIAPPLAVTAGAVLAIGVAGVANNGTNPVWLFKEAGIESRIDADSFEGNITYIECKDIEDLKDKVYRLKNILAEVL